MINQVILQHAGGRYYYRLHNTKLDKLDVYGKLGSYLKNMLANCPNEYFNNNGPRSSMLRFNLDWLDIKNVTGHEVSDLAYYALRNMDEADNHAKVENYMLEDDDKTIAVETPLWMHANEISNFKELFKQERPLTGHIDILRIDDNKIWIWDFKPAAHREKFAATQIFFYALMLSKRTGINLENFGCGYFDEKHAFMFKPELKMIKSYELKDFI